MVLGHAMALDGGPDPPVSRGCMLLVDGAYLAFSKVVVSVPRYAKNPDTAFDMFKCGSSEAKYAASI
jgi:hypothetical protein